MTRKLPLPVGKIHFIGIGGIGMSGIAEILHNLDYTVQGSDQRRNAIVERLSSLGIPTFEGHKPENVEGADLVVISSAVKPSNVELQAALAKKIPVIRRADMLAEIMRLKWSIAIAGSHGKTTTTSLVAHVLSTAEMDPTVINGGIINAYGTNAYLGSGDWMVVESDESDGSFLKLPSVINVVTNIDPEHLDHFKTFDKLKQSFVDFVERLPFYGFAVMCLDHPVVREIIPLIQDKKIITYGFDENADVRGVIKSQEADGTVFDVFFSPRLVRVADRMENVKLNMLGRHNVENALSAIAVAHQMGIKAAHIKQALQSFLGVQRRFTKVGEVNGAMIFDDYGHHPKEIQAVLNAARPVCKGKLVAVVQPHRYTRVRDLFDDFTQCFNGADQVYITPVYSAGEDLIEGATSAHLAEFAAKTGVPISYVEDPKALGDILVPYAQPDNFIVCLGAGDITAHAHQLQDNIEAALKASPRKAHG